MKKRMKIYGVIAGILLLVILTVGGVYFTLKRAQNAEPTMEIPSNASLDHEDVINLSKSSIVRIVQEVSGEMEVPIFSLNLAELSIEEDENGETLKIPFDEKIQGSGFIVHEDGYIMTNSHVISHETIKLMLSAEVAQLAVEETLTQAIAEVGLGLYQDEDLVEHEDEMIYAFGEEIVDYIRQESVFTLEKNVTVLKPSSREDEFDDVLEDGYRARVISVNDKFIEDDQDFALIKIDATDLPALELGLVGSDRDVGGTISVFGFPGSAEFNHKNILEPTFTSGTISAHKDAQLQDFSIYQTDAKVSRGSSGGPMLDDQGRVIGIVTFQANDLQRDAGDNFAFAIPIEVALDKLGLHAVSDDDMPEWSSQGTYGSHIRQGLIHKEMRGCKKALEHFSHVQELNENFPAKKYVESYVKECEEMIRVGSSIDSRYDEFSQQMRLVSVLVWVLVGVSFTVSLIFMGGFIYLLKKVRSNKVALDKAREQAENAQLDQ